MLVLFLSVTKARATIYSPDDHQLNPDCGPTDSNCGVSSLNLSNTNLTLSGARSIVMSGNALTLDGTADTIFSSNGGLSIGGDITANGGLSIAGIFSTPRGSDYTTAGSQDNVNFGSYSYVRYASASSSATFTGIAGGTDGRQLRITNASAFSIVFKNQNASSSPANQIITTSGGDLTITSNVTVTFQYDGAASRWRVVILPATSGTIGTIAFLQSGNSYGTTAVLGTNDAYGLDLRTNGATALSLDTSGNATISGDLHISGDDLFMGTNTSGTLLVADGTNFNPVVLSGDATIAANGALTINYSAAQSANVSTKGFLTAADWNTFNSKQAALGFTSENVANKSTVTVLGTSDTLYPTQNAVKTYVDNLSLGLNWKSSVELINVVGDSILPPGSPVDLDGYIILSGGTPATDWGSGLAAGDLVQRQSGSWMKIKSMIVGDYFGVSFKSATTPSGGMTGKNDYEAQITGGTAGAYTYTFTAPTKNDALFVQNTNAYYHNVSFTYASSSDITAWVQLSASADFSFSNGLTTAGTVVSLGALSSDWNQTGVFDITTAGDINLNGGDLKTSSSSATLFNTNATTLSIGGAATTISLGASGAVVTGAGALAINSGATANLTIDSGTTGALYLGTGNNAKTINLGTGNAGNTINIGTNNTTADTIVIGSVLDALSLTSTGLNVTSGGALTGVASINTITHSTTAITFAGAGTLSSTGSNALTIDSGTTGNVNIGNSANVKTIVIGNTTGATTLNLNSGSGGISLAGTINANANVISNIGNAGTDFDSSGGLTLASTLTTSNLGIEFIESDTNPTCASGNYTIYADTSEGKLKKCQNGTTSDLDLTGSDLQHAASYDTNEALTNITSSQTTLGTVSVTPSTATGDVFVTGQADVLSSNATDQPFNLVIETTSNCTGSTVGNASVTYTITAAGGNDRGTIQISGIAVDPGTSAQSYSLCASTSAGDTDVMNWRIEALVIDTGADLAEIYTTRDTSIEAGDVVSYDSALVAGVQKSAQIDNAVVVGVVSTRPGLLIGGADNEGDGAVPVALSGRVPVKVNNENGSIAVGDYLTLSSVPGIAMKATNAGVIIGQAIASYTGNGTGKILMFVKNRVNIGGRISENGISAGTLNDLIIAGGLRIDGEVDLGKDSIGEAVIKAGSGEVVVVFEKPYTYHPVVAISKLTQGILSDYYVSEITKTGFKIKIVPTQGNDMAFGWHSFGAKGGVRIFSDGVKENLDAVVNPPAILAPPATESSESATNPVSTSTEPALPESSPVAEPTSSESNASTLDVFTLLQAEPTISEPTPENSPIATPPTEITSSPEPVIELTPIDSGNINN